MERLTKKHERGYYMTIGPTERGNYDAIQRLGELEDAEEQGLLIRLPLAKDDAFWEINTGTTPASCYKRYAHLLAHCVYVLERLGKTCFLTREEAEAALAEMKNMEV